MIIFINPGEQRVWR